MTVEKLYDNKYVVYLSVCVINNTYTHTAWHSYITESNQVIYNLLLLSVPSNLK